METAYDRLDGAAAESKARFFGRPAVAALRDGSLSLDAYRAYLRETYHFIRHTSRFLSAAAVRFDEDLEEVRSRFFQHAVDEDGHQKLVLFDLLELGVQPAQVIESEPLVQTSALVAFHYYMANYLNPLGLFGTIYVFEGLGGSHATTAAQNIRARHGVGAGAVGFLTSHGKFDVEHIAIAHRIIDRFVTRDADLRAAVYCARGGFQLYGDMIEAAAADALRHPFRAKAPAAAQG